jgi:hypothetical protein
MQPAGGPLAAQQIELAQRTGAPPMDPNYHRYVAGSPEYYAAYEKEFIAWAASAPRSPVTCGPPMRSTTPSNSRGSGGMTSGPLPGTRSVEEETRWLREREPRSRTTLTTIPGTPQGVRPTPAKIVATRPGRAASSRSGRHAAASTTPGGMTSNPLNSALIPSRDCRWITGPAWAL